MRSLQNFYVYSKKRSISSGVSDSFPTLVNTGGAPCTSMEIAPTGKVMVIGDADGGVHMLSNEESATFQSVPVMPEFADEAFEETPVNMHNMNDSVSFIPYDYCPERLLSEWEPHKLRVLHRPSPVIPLELQGNIRQSDFVGYATNVLGWKASQVPYAKDSIQLRTPTRYMRMVHVGARVYTCVYLVFTECTCN